MEQLGADFNATGSLMTRQQLEEYRKKRGECVTCGRKCFKKKLFKFMPIDEPGFVMNGRCLSCNPLTRKEMRQTRNSDNGPARNGSTPSASRRSSSNGNSGSSSPTMGSTSRRTTRADLERFSLSQRNLSMSLSTSAQRRNTTAGASLNDTAAEAMRSLNLRSSSTTSAASSTPPTATTGLRQGRGSSPGMTHSRTIDRTYSSSSRSRNVLRTHSGLAATTSQSVSIPLAAASPPPLPAVIGSGSSAQSSPAISAVIGEPSQPMPARSSLNAMLNASSASVESQSMSASTQPPVHSGSASVAAPPSNSSVTHMPASASVGGIPMSAYINGNSSHSASHRQKSKHSGGDGKLARFLSADSSRRNLAATSRSGQSVRSNDSSEQNSAIRNSATSGSMRKPTKEELQRAAETILAAKQFGFHDEHLLHDAILESPSSNQQQQQQQYMGGSSHHHHHHQFQPPLHEDVYAPINSSFHESGEEVNANEMMMTTTMDQDGTRSQSSYGEEFEEDQHQHPYHNNADSDHQQQQQQQQQQPNHHDPQQYERVPVHGILNRGGEFSFNVPLQSNGGPRPVGSSRTLSSMSSIEEEIGDVPSFAMGGRMPSTQHISNVDAVYEGVEDASGSIPSSRNSDRRNGGSGSGNRNIAANGSHGPQPPPPPNRTDSHTEHQYIERIRSIGPDYAELLIILKEAIASPVVVQEGLEELSSLQLTPEDQDMLSQMGAPDVIVDAMQAHLSMLDVQLWGCGAVWNMSGTLRNQIAFVDAGAVDLILAAMEDFVDDIDIQEKGIAALSNMGAAVDNLSILSDKGVVEHVVAAMRKHAAVERVQIKGCSVIANLASHVSPLKQKIMDTGGGDAVVISMVMHPDDVYLQEKALRALRNLCANNDENKVELANIGAIDAVISAMQVHRDEAGVQEEGAWTLSNLAGNDQNKADIGDCYGIDAIIRAMWVHSDNVSVQEWCCRALFTLSLDVHNADAVLEVGGISAVVNAMQAHANSPAVQEMGCAVLGNLTNTDTSRMRIVDEEALDAIVMAMVLYADDCQVQERACMVLLRLAIPENFKAMQAANIGELVRTAGAKFPEKCEEPARRMLYAMED